MGKDTVRYLVEIKGSYFWQPSTKLRRAGWASEALGKDLDTATDRARARNKEVDAWRAAGKPARGSLSQQIPHGPTSRALPGTVGALIALYRKSTDFPTKPNTVRSYNYALGYLEKWLGPIPVRQVSPRMAKERYARLKTTAPAMAANLMRVARAMFSAARTLSEPQSPLFVRDNPFRELKLEGSEPSGIRWTRAERDTMCAAAETLGFHSIALAIRVNWWLGQREADVLALPPRALEGETLTIQQGKTAQRVYLPVSIVPGIAAAHERFLEARRRSGLASLTHLLMNERIGKEWDEHAFRKIFREIREAAAATLNDPDAAARMRTLTFMHLRHTAVCEMYEAGCELQEIAAITGHTLASVTRILERYGLRTRQLAVNAINRRLQREREDAG